MKDLFYWEIPNGSRDQKLKSKVKQDCKVLVLLYFAFWECYDKHIYMINNLYDSFILKKISDTMALRLEAKKCL